MTDPNQESTEIRFFRELGGDQLVEEVEAYEAYLREENRNTDATMLRKAWTNVGAVLDYEAIENGLHLTCEHGYVSLLWVGDDCVRVWVRKDNDFSDGFSYIVDETPQRPTQYELLDEDNFIVMQTGHLACYITRSVFGVGLYTLAGDYLCGAMTTAEYSNNRAVRLSMALMGDETCYGLGERAFRLNLRGRQYALWNMDQPNCDPGTDPLYYCVPFYVGVHGGGAYGVLWDNWSRGFVDIASKQPNRLSFESELGALRYYLMAGSTVEAVQARYADITGKIPLPPLWYLGYHQSRFSYRSQAEVEHIARTMREKRIPCDAIYLDVHYMDNFKVGTWDEKQFPNFVGMVSSLHNGGFRVIVIVDPGVKREDGYSVYESGIEADVFVKTRDGGLLQTVVWAGASVMPDFTNPKTHEWWQDQLAPLIYTGIDGIWNDMNEPAVFTTKGAVTLPDGVKHYGGKHAEVHNLYGLLMAQASRIALDRHRRGKRQVNITRSGYVGAQRYASSWTGDVTSDWEHLRLMVPQVLNLGLSGVALTGSDIGGFKGDTDGELLTRWIQAGSLMPFFRNHGAMNTVAQEPWAFGEPYERIIRSAIELRYQLMPYLYSAVAQCAEFGVPIVRPIFTVSPKQPELREIDDQFMVGSSLMVAPVLEKGQTQREVVMPDGEWYEFYTHQYVYGGQTIAVDAPLGKLPIFVRGGSVIPMWAVRQHLSGTLPTEVRMRVFPGNLETSLYEDDGESLDYLNGLYRWVYITSRWENNRFKVERRIAGHYQPYYERIRLEIMGFAEEPVQVKIDRQGAPVWYYDNKIVELTVGDFQQLEVMRQVGPTDETVASRPF